MVKDCECSSKLILLTSRYGDHDGKEIVARFSLTFPSFPMALPANSDLRPLIQFRNYFSKKSGLLGRVISPSQGLYLNIKIE
jgi:hypothetical protein